MTMNPQTNLAAARWRGWPSGSWITIRTYISRRGRAGAPAVICYPVGPSTRGHVDTASHTASARRTEVRKNTDEVIARSETRTSGPGTPPKSRRARIRNHARQNSHRVLHEVHGCAYRCGRNGTTGLSQNSSDNLGPNHTRASAFGTRDAQAQ